MRYAELDDLDETVDDSTFEDWQLERMIEVASTFVDRAVAGAYYETDGLEYPTDPVIREAFKNAVKAQVSFWADNSIDPAGGRSGVVSAVSRDNPPSAGVEVSFGSVKYSEKVAVSTVADVALEDATASLTGLTPYALSFLPDELLRRYVTVLGWGA